jgi:site-specific recombinase XerD
MQPKIKVKLPQALPRAIPTEDVQRILAAIATVRERALILLLLRTGMRIGELLGVKISDINLAERKILIYVGEKNFQGRTVYYNKDAEQALRDWLKERDTQSDYLFPGRTGPGTISYVTAWSVMRSAVERAGLSNKGYSLHNLRHTFATDMLNAGMRLEVLQQILGHQEIEMTLRYAKMTDLTRENEYFNAMDRIEQGERHESRRVHTELQKVFEEKKLHRTKRK